MNDPEQPFQSIEIMRCPSCRGMGDRKIFQLLSCLGDKNRSELHVKCPVEWCKRVFVVELLSLFESPPCDPIEKNP